MTNNREAWICWTIAVAHMNVNTVGMSNKQNLGEVRHQCHHHGGAVIQTASEISTTCKSKQKCSADGGCQSHWNQCHQYNQGQQREQGGDLSEKSPLSSLNASALQLRHYRQHQQQQMGGVCWLALQRCVIKHWTMAPPWSPCPSIPLPPHSKDCDRKEPPY